MATCIAPVTLRSGTGDGRCPTADLREVGRRIATNLNLLGAALRATGRHTPPPHLRATMAKTVKSDAKKAAKKAAAEHQKKLEATVKAAYDVDPATALAPFLARPFSKNGIDAVAAPSTVKQLSADDKKWIWKLLEGNMRPVFGEEVWKAREGKDKKNEMVDDDARYIIVRSAPAADPENADPNGPAAPGEPLGFVHYRFVIEEDVAVMYVYELQLDAKATRKGLGRYLMMLCEALAKKASVSGVMLTVQKANEGAIKFYTGCKYVMSVISPTKVEPWAADEYDYEIYNKIWDADALKYLERSARVQWAENKKMFDQAQMFVMSNEELNKELGKELAAAKLAEATA